MPDKIKALMDHNLEEIKRIGAREIIFTCPSCYHTWKHLYQPEVKLHHASQFLAGLIESRKIDLKPKEIKVTYHDPCDLGRNSGILKNPARSSHPSPV